MIANIDYVSSWKSKGLSAETINPPATSDNSLTPALSSHIHDPTLKNCLFRAVILTKNTDIDKYGYCGYGTGFDKKSSFTFPGGGMGQNVITFGVDMSSSAHIDRKKKYILILGIGPIQGLKHTLTAEKMYSINFTVTKKIA